MEIQIQRRLFGFSVAKAKLFMSADTNDTTAYIKFHVYVGDGANMKVWPKSLLNDIPSHVQQRRFQSQVATPTISLSKAIAEDGSDFVAAVSILLLFGFNIVLLHLLRKGNKTDSLQTVSELEQWSGLSSELGDTDLWRRYSGNMIEAHSDVSTAVILRDNYMSLLLCNLMRLACVKGCGIHILAAMIGGFVQLMANLFVIGAKGNT